MKFIFVMLLLLLNPFYINGQSVLSEENKFSLGIESCLKESDMLCLHDYTSNIRSGHYDKYTTDDLIYNSIFLALAQANTKHIGDAIKTLDSLSEKTINHINKQKIDFLIIGVKGIAEYRQNNYLKCSYNLNAGISFLSNYSSRNRLDNFLLALFYRYLGRSFSETGVYLQAISVLDESNKIYLSLNNIQNTYINDKYIGRTYVLKNKNANGLESLAIKKFLYALNGFKAYEMKDEIPWIYTIISDYYINNNEIDLAKTYQDSAFVLLTKDETLLKGLAYNNYGEIDEFKNKLFEAKRNYYKAIATYKRIDNYSNRAVTYYNLSSVFLRENNLLEAMLYADSSLFFAKRTQNFDKVSKVYAQFSKLYKLQFDFENAYYFLRKSTYMVDSLQQKQNKVIAYAYNAIYQTAEKEKENQKLQFENKIQKQENTKIKTRNLFLLSLSGLVLLLFIITFFVYQNIQKNKFNRLMLSEIDEQNDIISKNLHDGMSGYLHAIKNSLVFRNEKTKDLNKEIKTIDRSQKELRFLMRQLSSPYYKNKDFDLSNELNELSDFYENTSNFKIDSYFDKSIIWKNISYENKLQIYKLAQELLANVKKHSGASNISLQIIKDKNNLIMSFEDNGKGFDPKEASYGYGLKNIDKRIKELRGELNIDSNIGQGTFIILTLPVLS